MQGTKSPMNTDFRPSLWSDAHARIFDHEARDQQSSMRKRSGEVIAIPPVKIRGLAMGSVALSALALGSVAIGSAAVGALAVGALVVGRLKVGKANLKEVAIGRLTVDEFINRRPGPAVDDLYTDS